MDKFLITFLVSFILSIGAVNGQSSLAKLKENGYVDVDFSAGYGTFERWNSNLSVVPGVELNKHFSAGLGLRYKYMYSRWKELNMYAYDELALEVRGYSYLRDAANTPFLRLSGGYTFTLPKNNQNTKPLFYNIGIGQRFKLKKRELLLSTSYEYNKSRFTYRDGWGLFSSNYQSDWYRNHSFNGSITLRF